MARPDLHDTICCTDSAATRVRIWLAVVAVAFAVLGSGLNFARIHEAEFQALRRPAMASGMSGRIGAASPEAEPHLLVELVTQLNRQRDPVLIACLGVALQAAFAAGVIALLGRGMSRDVFTGLTLVIAVIFVSPSAWSHLRGHGGLEFEPHRWIALGMIATSATMNPLSWRWWAGFVIGAAGSGFSLDTVWGSAAASVVTVVAVGRTQRSRRDLAAFVLWIALALFSLVRSEIGSAFSFNQSVADIVIGTESTLAWPANRVPWLFLVIELPLVLLMVDRVRCGTMERVDRVLAGVAVWCWIRAIAGSSLAGSGYANDLPSFLTSSTHLLIAGIAVLRLQRAEASQLRFTVLLVWCSAVAWGVANPAATRGNSISDRPSDVPHVAGGDPRNTITLSPVEGSHDFDYREPSPLTYAPATRVWVAAHGPAKFVSEPLVPDTLPVLQFWFAGDPRLPPNMLYLESYTGDREYLPVGRLAGDRWQFGHIPLPPGERVRVVVDLPAGRSWFAFQNPAGMGRWAWGGHYLRKFSGWILGIGIVLLVGLATTDSAARNQLANWIDRQLVAWLRCGREHTLFESKDRPFVSTRGFAIAGIGVTFLALAWRQHHFVDSYSVNIMSWDQWGFYHPLFAGEGWWKTFTYQHGPHRQGIAFVITRALANLSGWNSQWDAFATSFFLIGAAGLGFVLMRRFGYRISLVWIGVPLVFLNFRQDLAIIGAANLSHGSMPVFLIISWGLCWSIERPWLRQTFLCVLTFLLVFTGFGLFMGLLTPLMFLIEGAHAIRSGNKAPALGATAGLFAVFVVWAVFAHGYHFMPAIENFRFPYEKPWEYAEFAALMVSNFLGVPGSGWIAIAVGLVGGWGIGVTCAVNGWRVIRDGPEHTRRETVIFCFSAYTLIFCANTAIGRTMGGLEGALTSRYVTLLIPGAFAVLLELMTRSKSAGDVRVTRAWVYVVLLAAGTAWLHESDWNFARSERDGRLAWKRVYLATRSEQIADEKAAFRIFPGSVKEQLDFLERHKLNLFNPGGMP